MLAALLLLVLAGAVAASPLLVAAGAAAAALLVLGAALATATSADSLIPMDTKDDGDGDDGKCQKMVDVRLWVVVS